MLPFKVSASKIPRKKVFGRLEAKLGPYEIAL